MMKKSRKSSLLPAAKNYLLAGDATAIPVIGTMLENLPPTAQGHCVIEVRSKEEEQTLYTKAAITYHWLYNRTPAMNSQLPEIVRMLGIADDNRYAFVAAEFSVVKEIRQYLKEVKKMEREEFSAHAYWKLGATEVQSVAERRSS